jgi:hypothetical protein
MSQYNKLQIVNTLININNSKKELNSNSELPKTKVFGLPASTSQPYY